MSMKLEALGIYRDLMEDGFEIEILRENLTYDPSTQSSVPTNPQRYKTYAIALPASGGTVQAFDNRAENQQFQFIRFFKMSSIDENLEFAFQPLPGDIARFGGYEWQIMGCTPVAPTPDFPLLYNVGAGR